MRSVTSCVLMVLASCASTTTSAVIQPDHAVTTMSRLRATMRRPIVEVESFEESGGGFEGPRDRMPPTPPTDAPFETDSAAVAAAIGWIIAHFGPLPPDTTLVPTSVDQSASGNEAPNYDWDIGHTIVLHQFYRGTKTDIASVVYIRGRSHFSGHFALAEFEQVPGTEGPVIGSAAAVEAFLDWSRQHGEDVDEDTIARFRELAKPRLEYVRSNAALGSKHEDLQTPSWSLTPGWWVDAYSGVVWRDC